MKPVILGVTTLLLAKQTRHLERLVRDDDDFRLKGWAGATETTFGREWDKRPLHRALDRRRSGLCRGKCFRAAARSAWGTVGGRKALPGDGSLLRDKPGNLLLQPPDLRRSNRAPGVLRIRIAKGWWRIVDGAFCKPVDTR